MSEAKEGEIVREGRGKAGMGGGRREGGGESGKVGGRRGKVVGGKKGY